MRVASFSVPHLDTPRVGIVVDGTDPCAEQMEFELADLTDALPGLGTPLDLLMAASAGARARIEEALRRAPRVQVPVAALQAPVPRPGKFIGIGFNYRAHAEEMGVSAAAPLFFNKQVTCVTGPRSDVPLPSGTSKLDYEGELALVIGRRCRNIPAERAHEVIAGWLVCNDISARDWQREAQTVTLGKSFDGFGPTGPWVVTPDEVADPQQLSLRTTVNGGVRQNGCTVDMIHSVAEQIAYLSRRCTLCPGDLLTTGSPAGSAQGRTPSPWLRDGDIVRVTVESVGVIENRIVAWPDEICIEEPEVTMNGLFA